MKLIITGASGTAGSETLKQALLDPEVKEVTALVRRPTGLEHPKLKTLIHKDFLNYAGLEPLFRNSDACIWCLGISQTKVSKAEYEVITYDYTMAAAKAMHTANPDLTFIFLSGMGADSTEKSRTIFARLKGKAENALQKVGFKKLVCARPGGIISVTPREGLPWFERYLSPVMGFFAPGFVIDTVHLGKALIWLAKHGSEKIILENKELKALVAMERG
ncbi:MAG: NAD(P)H-binding protein [Bacteroidia bacterium]